MKNGWATMPGTTDANRQVAVACAEKLALNTRSLSRALAALSLRRPP